MGIALLVSLAHVIMLSQELNGSQEQIVKIERVVELEQGLVAFVDPPGDLAKVGLGSELLDADQLVLGGRDGGVDPARLKLLGIQIELLQGAFDERALVHLVEDDEFAVHLQTVRLAPQHPRAEGMEGPQADPAQRRAGGGPAVQQVFHAALHLAGGLVGEGDRHDFRSGRAAVAHQIGDPVR